MLYAFGAHQIRLYYIIIYIYIYQSSSGPIILYFTILCEKALFCKKALDLRVSLKPMIWELHASAELARGLSASLKQY
jgi:hypothetical protein